MVYICRRSIDNMRTTQALFVSLILFFAIIGFVFAEENLSAPSTAASAGPENDTQSNTTMSNSTRNPVPACEDSDGGLYYYTRCQIVEGGDAISIDYCNENKLTEQYCSENGRGARVEYICPNGCKDGACIPDASACKMPACLGAYDTGKIDEYGCAVLACPTSTDNQDSCLNNPDYWWDQQTNQCYKEFSKKLIANSCSDPDGGINKYQQAHTFGFRSVFADSKDQRIRTGGKDACLSSNQVVEHYCDSDGFIQTTYLDCRAGCSNGACIKGEDIKEQITCIFKGAKTEQECYTADIVKAKCKGMESCITGLSAPKGEKITWKSSCGGYQYTIQDGDDETITFECATGETNATQVENNAFRNAYWQCYDGKESWQGGESSCKPYGLWKKYASEFCNARCSSGREKCGVNSFSLSTSCYTDDTTMYNDTTDATAIIPTTSNNTQEESILVCKDSCPLDGKCYPFGYRKAGNFCADSGKFEPQFVADKTCDNNFECGSNICISGKCVDEGFAQKIINWFKRLFGGE